jgi:hypothetical protein
MLERRAPRKASLTPFGAVLAMRIPGVQRSSFSSSATSGPGGCELLRHAVLCRRSTGRHDDTEAIRVPNGRGDRTDLVQVVEAADRAGSIVTEQVRSIIEAAETNAEEIRRSAQRDAVAIRQQAAAAANRILERLGALEAPLGELVEGLRREADSLSADAERGTH